MTAGKAPTARSGKRDDPLFCDSPAHFWRKGAWRTSQIGNCGTCGHTYVGAVWAGDRCTAQNCTGVVGATTDVARRGAT